MIDTIEIVIKDKKYTYSKNITLQEIYMEHQETHDYPIIIAKVNNRLRELSYKLTENCTVEFLDLTSSEGNRVHISGLIFVLLYAIKKLYGKDADIRVRHSLDKGLYIQTTFKLTEEKLSRIKEKNRTMCNISHHFINNILSVEHTIYKTERKLAKGIEKDD